jgi:hypothetical protein
MVAIPEFENSIANLIDKHHEERTDRPRPHMGASMLGHPCDRWLWLSFRWAVQPSFSGRMLRLFRRGHREEPVIIADLRAIGIQVKNIQNQDRVDFGTHVSGSIDAIIDGGVPEAPNRKHIGEFKTHNLKSFNKLTTEGVQKAKPDHYVQMQVYMHGTGIDRALYVAVCKDDDRIYTERVRYDEDVAEKAVERGRRLALLERMPPPISTDPTWWQCKFCDAYSFCHQTKLTKHVNCRTCAHSTPEPNSTWTCSRYDGAQIEVEYQHQGCDSHTLHPDLVPWPMQDSEFDYVACYTIDGVAVLNGDGHFLSREILANPEGCTSKTVAAVKKAFPGSEVVI